MNYVDLLALAVLAVFAFVGWRGGFASNLFTGTGMIGGFVLGTLLAPMLYEPGSSDPLVAVSAVALMIGTGLLGANLMGLLGRLIPRPKGRLRIVDSLLGSAFNLTVASMALWAVGHAVTAAPALSVTEEIRDSRVMTGIDRHMPDVATELLGEVSTAITTEVFPKYLNPFESEPILPVPKPDNTVLTSPGVGAAAAGTVQIRGDNDCMQVQFGSGFVHAPNRVATSAHVVAGVAAPQVVKDGTAWDARVVLFDPVTDVAVLAVPGLGLEPLRMAPAPRSQDSAVVLGHPEGGPLQRSAARVRGTMELRSTGPKKKDRVSHEVLSLHTKIRAGTSGGPVVTPKGRVLGMVFATSRTDGQTAYALTANQLEEQLAEGVKAKKRVSTGKCQ